MKVAYIFATQGHTVSYKLGKMILPQLENDAHGVEVVGMFFFEDNNYVLVKGDPLGERRKAYWVDYLNEYHLKPEHCEKPVPGPARIVG